jgi:glycosyltransferase involved in cell wall biosynthesis
MPKKWKATANRPTAIFTGNTGPLHPDFSKFHGERFRFIATALQHQTDIFVACSHFQIPTPSGKSRNVVLTFFPNPAHKEAVKPYDTVVTCSNFSAEWVQKYWKKKAVVIHPYIDLKGFRADLQKAPKTILNVGRFFREPHGHSKRQDVLIRAFATLHKTDPSFCMVLAGAVHSPSDRRYLDFCKSLAVDLEVSERIEFYENAGFDDLQRLYSGAQFYWHGNGYGSDNPYETEHFGIVIAEAMASGCTPFIFADGGFQDFQGAVPWTTPTQLAQLTLKGKLDPPKMREFVEQNFTKEQMRQKVHSLFFNAR